MLLILVLHVLHVGGHARATIGALVLITQYSISIVYVDVHMHVVFTRNRPVHILIAQLMMWIHAAAAAAAAAIRMATEQRVRLVSVVLDDRAVADVR